MKILFISHEDSKFGAPKSLIELVRTLKRTYNVEPVLLLHSKDDLYKICDEEDIENYVIGHRNIISKKTSSLSSPIKFFAKKVIYEKSKFFALKKIEKIIDMSKIDIIHTNVSIVDIGMELNRKYGIPHIIHLREPASINEKFYFCRKNYIEYLNSYTTKAIAISKYIKEEWAKRGVESEKIDVIYNGLDLSEISESKHENKKIKIVFCGSISEEKGQIKLIEALNMLPNNIKKELEVDFIGKGDNEYKNLIINKVNEFRLREFINFKGYIKNISKNLSNYDIGIICSEGEPFGRVTVEYMSAGLCVIAANTGASPEIIENNIDGFLYDNKNISDLADKIENIVRNKQIIKKVGNNAIKAAKEKFSTDINAKNIYKLYLKLLDKKNSLSKDDKVKDAN
ncbi:glycosyltransferase family 4 protein [Clostridium perfringens]|nr:glycosyltransferase family 4 protein [Clostridium perfringens]MDM0864865.1 glycosyltransferase family 4 protein [Clostridium perfringens]